ncbi:RmlC-like cupins superfamily protein [Prunus dulcis]|uniref:RmlC-like cupins superfamily protein n=1 Tax=Prunus dulcis TaxID=3755 RepID=A0A4Y1R1F3_PRUDU|nr:RmlC-like cupins superfamily protein [Prunus dulcis]
MVEPVTPDCDEERSLLQESSNVEGSWRLNFDGFQVSSEHKEKRPPRGLHDCLGVLGNLHRHFHCQSNVIFFG